MTAATIGVVALMTWLARGLPYLMFGGKKELPKVVSYLGTVLPASIMIILVVYCLRNIKFTIFPFGLAEMISVALVIAVQLWKKNTFLSILLGTACYMVLIRTVFQI
jgi:branched-subunit amino acid transport protein AzlD